MALITAYWGLDGMIILMTIMITAYLYMTRKFTYWKKRGILQIAPTPFFGNFKECLFLKKAPAYFLKEMYEENKELPYVGFYVLHKPFLLIRNRELVKNILVKDFNYFSDRYNTADPNDRIGYANLFFIRNPTWKTIRTKLTPFFTSGKMKKMFDLMLICANNLNEHLDSLQLEGTRMGLLQTKLGIITIIRNYKVAPCRKTAIPMVLDPKATMLSPLGDGIHFNIRRININAN